MLSRDEHTDAQSLKPVLRTMVHPVTDLIHVRVATDTITATPNHPFRVAGRGWVAVGELTAGDTLYLADGGRADIVSVTREKLAIPLDVYNVEVADFHTYFVAGAGVWVHNCGGEAARIAEARANSPIEIPEGHIGRIADNLNGVVFEDPTTAVRNANSIRIMDEGYYRWYNGTGQPLDIFGNPSTPDATHIPWK